MLEQMKKEAEGLRSIIEKILSVDRKKLYGAEIWGGSISFKEKGKDSFEMIFQLIEKLSKCDLDKVPYNYNQQMHESLGSFDELIEHAMSFDINTSNAAPARVRDEIIYQVENLYPHLCLQAQPTLALGFIDTDTKSKQLLDSLQNSVTEGKELREKVKKESDDTLKIVWGMAAEAGVSKNAKYYADAKRKHANLARLFFVAMIVLLVILILGAIGLYFCSYQHKDSLPSLGYQEIAILFVTVLLIYGAFFCSRIFNAEKHNEIVNDNKANALSTFLAFVKSTEDKEIKDQILLHAATAIFANTATGFSKDQGMPIHPGVELMRRASRSVEAKG